MAVRKARVAPKPKPQNHHKKGTTAIRIKDHAPNPPHTGHTERLQAYSRRATELKRLDYCHWEIAEMMAKEFNMETIPSIATISNWLDLFYRTTEEETKRIQWQYLHDQYRALDKMKRKWMAIALQDEVQIQRWVTIKGERQPTIDEEAIKEQLHATEVVVKIMARQARLFGLDLEKAPGSEDGANIGSMQVWIIQEIAKMAGAVIPNGKVIDVEEGGVQLELTSGLPEDTDTL